MFLLKFERRPGPGEEPQEIDLSLDSFTDCSQGSSSDSLADDAKLIGTASLSKLRKVLKDQGIMTDTNDLIVAQLDPRGRRTIDNDTNLQEALRRMAAEPDLKQVKFFVCPEIVPIEALFDDVPVESLLPKHPHQPASLGAQVQVEPSLESQQAASEVSPAVVEQPDRRRKHIARRLDFGSFNSPNTHQPKAHNQSDTESGDEYLEPNDNPSKARSENMHHRALAAMLIRGEKTREAEKIPIQEKIVADDEEKNDRRDDDVAGGAAGSGAICQIEWIVTNFLQFCYNHA